MNEKKDVATMKEDLLAFLREQSLDKLRSVGRFVGVERSTAKKKEELIEKIVAVEEGSLPPAPETKKGAPVKNDFVDPKIMEKLEAFRFATLSTTENAGKDFPFCELETEQTVFEIHSPDYDPDDGIQSLLKDPEIGQVTAYRGAYCLFPLSGDLSDIENEPAVILPALMEEHDLREGDVISCDVRERNKTKLVSRVLAVCGFMPEERRPRFEALTPVYPERKICFSDEGYADFATKLLDLIAPVGFGQRVLIAADGRNGQKDFLSSVLRALRRKSDVRLIYLSVGDSPERQRETKKALRSDQFVSASYEKGADYAVFAANFALARAKRYVESGQNVCLVVDSFNALARAYDATSLSSGGKTLARGLESKTAQFLKDYFGAARCFENRASLTMIGGLTVEKGDEADELLRRELGDVANAYVKLKRIPYASHALVDLLQTTTERGEKLLSDEEKDCVKTIYRQLLPAVGEEGVCELLDSDLSLEETLSQIKAKASR